MEKLQIKYIPIRDITPYENNPRINDQAVDALANSIKEFGFKQPIVIDKDNVIVCGHTRYKAMKKLGVETISCIMADDLTPEQIKAYRLADNKTAELSTWDFNLLDTELDNILDLNMGDFGFNFDETDFISIDKEEDVETDGINPQAPNKVCTCPQCGFTFEV